MVEISNEESKSGSGCDPLLEFLDRHFGDGLIYIQTDEDRRMLGEAIALGFVSWEGYLTPKGYTFWQRGSG